MHDNNKKEIATNTVPPLSVNQTLHYIYYPKKKLSFSVYHKVIKHELIRLLLWNHLLTHQALPNINNFSQQIKEKEFIAIWQKIEPKKHPNAMLAELKIIQTNQSVGWAVNFKQSRNHFIHQLNYCRNLIKMYYPNHPQDADSHFQLIIDIHDMQKKTYNKNKTFELFNTNPEQFKQITALISVLFYTTNDLFTSLTIQIKKAEPKEINEQCIQQILQTCILFNATEPIIMDHQGLIKNYQKKGSKKSQYLWLMIRTQNQITQYLDIRFASQSFQEKRIYYIGFVFKSFPFFLKPMLTELFIQFNKFDALLLNTEQNTNFELMYALIHIELDKKQKNSIILNNIAQTLVHLALNNQLDTGKKFIHQWITNLFNTTQSVDQLKLAIYQYLKFIKPCYANEYQLFDQIEEEYNQLLDQLSDDINLESAA